MIEKEAFSPENIDVFMDTCMLYHLQKNSNRDGEDGMDWIFRPCEVSD